MNPLGLYHEDRIPIYPSSRISSARDAASVGSVYSRDRRWGVTGSGASWPSASGWNISTGSLPNPLSWERSGTISAGTSSTTLAFLRSTTIAAISSSATLGAGTGSASLLAHAWSCYSTSRTGDWSATIEASCNWWIEGSSSGRYIMTYICVGFFVGFTGSCWWLEVKAGFNSGCCTWHCWSECPTCQQWWQYSGTFSYSTFSRNLLHL